MTGRAWDGLEPIAGVDALVTGSSRGLGFAIAQAYAAEGARVWMVADCADELEAAVAEIRTEGGQVEARVVDLGDDAARAALAEELLDAAPELRVLANNAAILERQSVAELETTHWQRLLAVNLTAPVLLTRDLLPALTERGGSVINVSSRAGVLGFENQAAYCASKFGIEAFTRCLALELAGSLVSANTVTPGLHIKPTSITRAEASSSDSAVRAEWADPLRLAPAFCLLAGLRGQVSGLRFDALTLTRAIRDLGVEETLASIETVAERIPPAPEAD
jgi:NAD(P)-dependent dehydrogenase (short-subunit alcohol dehydrogenase family)